MSESVKNVLIIGNDKEFIIRNCVNQLINQGNTVYLSDTNTSIVSPVHPAVNTIIIFSDGNSAMQHILIIPEACTINKEISICLIGDKMGIQKALSIIPKDNIKKVLYRPVGLNEILDAVANIDEQPAISGKTNGIALLCTEHLFNVGFTKKFSSYKVYSVEDFVNLPPILDLRNITLLIIESVLLEANDYANYNILCDLASFQRLPLIMLVESSDVVTLARANIMRPMDIIAKDMPVEKIESIVDNAINNPVVTMHQSIIIQGAQTTETSNGSILNNLNNFGVNSIWD